MKTTRFIMLAVLLTCVLGVRGAWAETAGYISSTANTVTYTGVVGAEYRGDSDGGAAFYGEATAAGYGHTYGGFFGNYSMEGVAVWGAAAAATGYTYGGFFFSRSTSGTGVYSGAWAATGYTYGGKFENLSTNGTGVYSIASATTGYTYGGSFESKSTNGTGVYSIASATSGNARGGNFMSKSTTGIGVAGYASATTGASRGGYFESKSTTGIGVNGFTPATTGATKAGSFQSNSTSGTGVYGYAQAATGATKGGSFQTNSTTGKGVEGVALKTTGLNYGVYGQTSSPSGYGVYSKGNMKVEGKFTVTGTKSAVVKLEDGKGVTLYAVEASENWFEDFGSSKLTEGKAVVQIDPTFVKTVNTETKYHAFLTPDDDCKGLYVTDKKGTSFEVRELNGGKSDISFSYRIVAKRKGYEDQRLVQVNDDQTPTIATTAGEKPQEHKVMEMASQVK